MTKFTMHTPETAPEASRPWLIEAKKSLGFVPNMFAGLAESPTVLNGYQTLSDLFAKTRLSPVEQQVVALSVSIENECEYCVGAHSVIAKNAAKVPAPIIEALRSGGKLPDPKLDALATFSRIAVRKRGWVDEPTVKAVIDAGYDRGQLLEVILGISMKTLSNYANHLMGTSLDKEFESGRWTRTRNAA
jgi:AhpD family alkylhydroperoxidase